MSPDRDPLAALPARLAEAVDFALLQGLLKYSPQGALAHAPFALIPCPLASPLLAEMEALTAPFNRLALAVARAPEFLQEVLAPAARTDAFTARLLALAAEGRGSQPLHLAVTRSDYFVHQPTPEAAPALRQVELNTIAASYPGLSARVTCMHRYLLAGTALEARLVPQDPLPLIADGFAEAHRRYGVPDACVLMVVQPGETNVFDQRLLEFALRERGLIVRRLPLEEIAQRGRLHEGHLRIDGEVMAITYFRAAYGPEDFTGEDAFRARGLIEASATIAVPTLHSQLAGAKKVQQVLTDPATLRRFLGEADAQAVEACFAAQWDLERTLPTAQGERAAWQVAREHPADWVLKPQREGGGHNHFDRELVDTLDALTPAQRSSYVLMERIRPPAHRTFLVREGDAVEAEAVSEIGRFGVHVADDGREVLNRDAGYLVRSKRQDTQEGGVSAGFGFLDSLLLVPPGQA